MAPLDINSATTTDLKNVVEDFSVPEETLDTVGAGKETYWYFKDVQKNLGYLKTIPEYWSSLKAMALWVVGKGYESENLEDEPRLKKITGYGKDTIISILEGMIIIKKAIGDAFAQIIRNDTGALVNLKPISPERVRIVYNPNGMIKRYDIRKSNGKWQDIATEDMFHLVNDRIADETHGTDTVSVLKWVIDARNEALEDERKIKHRDMALGIAYYNTDNKGKITYVNTQIEAAVKNGEMLGLPNDTVEIREFPSKNTGNRLEWIRYLEGFFYQTSGVPRVMVTSEGFTEAGGKVGYLTFEPVYTNEQLLLEADIWNQLAIKIKFNKPPTLSGTMKEDEAKNTGQLGFQPKDTQATMERE